jgi:hypothetical protein
MPRLSGRAPAAISLFPFLSVLVSVIGAMTLVIACAAMGQIEEATGGTGDSERQKAELAKTRQALKDAEAAIAALRVQLKAGQEQLDAAKKAIEPDKAPVKIQPQGSGLKQKPTFIEVTSVGIKVLGKSALEVDHAAIASDGALRKLLERHRPDHPQAEAGAIVVFLIRPDAVRTYYRAENVANDAKARHAKLPVPGYGPLDLSLFGNR